MPYPTKSGRVIGGTEPLIYDPARQMRATDKLALTLESFDARCERLPPVEDLGGAKDWNEALQTQGRDASGDWPAARVLVE